MIALSPDAARGPDRVGDPKLQTLPAPRASILIVEDERELRELIAYWLGTIGYEVSEASDGLDALELLEAGLSPDVILLDLTMPRMDGRAFLDWLRSSPRHRHRRVIVTSAYLDGEAMPDADRAFGKPFPPDQLAREIGSLALGG